MGRRAATIIGIVLAGLLAVGARADDTLQQIKKKGVLVAGVKFGVPPFGFVDPSSGEFIGYDVDVLSALASKLGVNLKLRRVDQKTRIPALLDGDVDIVAANLTANPDTGKVIAFSEVYLTTGVGFLTRTGTVKTLSDLRGKKIAVGAGTFAEEVVQMAVSGATTVVFDDYRKALQALETGAVDGGAGDASILPALLPMLPSGAFEVPSFRIAEIPYVLGMRRGDPAFLDFVNQTLQGLRQTGELEKLQAKWFQPQASPEEGPVAVAAGVISRKAATPPRFLAVIMKGDFEKGAEVSVFSTKGDFVCKGTVAAVFDDQVYVDVDPAKYEFVRPGFAVGMGVNGAAAKGAILKHQDVLLSVEDQSKAEQQAFEAQREAEGIADEKRRQEEDKLNYQNNLNMKAENARARDNNTYYYNVNRTWRRY